MAQPGTSPYVGMHPGASVDNDTNAQRQYDYHTIGCTRVHPYNCHAIGCTRVHPYERIPQA
ncbi:MAG: hypothetical protein K2G82_04080 [Paramuribaculum sp.]|nr:hypothetical protein [Paramuribaculum sp.]